MKTFSQFLAEANAGAGLTIFDIDDTLMHTTAKIAVMKDGKVVRELSNQEYNTYKLQPGESFDFGQFKDSAKFYDESQPISRMIAKANAIVRNSKNTDGSRVIIVTARDDFDDKEKFLATFRKHGMMIDDVYVERAGKIRTGAGPAQKKAIIISKYLETGKYSRVRLFDDSRENLSVFLKLQTQFPDVQFQAYFANPDGSIKTVKS